MGRARRNPNLRGSGNELATRTRSHGLLSGSSPVGIGMHSILKRGGASKLLGQHRRTGGWSSSLGCTRISKSSVGSQKCLRMGKLRWEVFSLSKV